MVVLADLPHKNLVIRDLKPYSFVLDRDEKTVTITEKETGIILQLSKTYAFSLMRALVSFAQKMTVTPRKART